MDKLQYLIYKITFDKLNFGAKSHLFLKSLHIRANSNSIQNFQRQSLQKSKRCTQNISGQIIRIFNQDFMHLKNHLYIFLRIIRISWKQIHLSRQINSHGVSTNRKEKPLHHRSPFIILKRTRNLRQIRLCQRFHLILLRDLRNRTPQLTIISQPLIPRRRRRANRRWLQSHTNFSLVRFKRRFILIFSLSKIILFCNMFLDVPG